MPANLWGNVGRGYTSFGRGAVLAQSKGQYSECMWESRSSGWVSSLLCQQNITRTVSWPANPSLDEHCMSVILSGWGWDIYGPHCTSHHCIRIPRTEIRVHRQPKQGGRLATCTFVRIRKSRMTVTTPSAPTRGLVSYGPYSSGGWKLQDLALRPLRHKEVLIEMVASGVCHTDLHCADAEGGFGVHYPRVMGHEGALVLCPAFFVYIKKINGDLMADLRSWVCSTGWIWRRNSPDRGFGHSVIFCLPEL